MGTIFWQVLDVPKMIAATGDPKGDVWYHARGCLIQAVSRVTLEDFMSRFNEIVTEATSREGDEFRLHRQQDLRRAAGDHPGDHEPYQPDAEPAVRERRHEGETQRGDRDREAAHRAHPSQIRQRPYEGHCGG